MVRGIRGFTRQRHIWPTPIAVIGTGHAGLRQAMYFIKNKDPFGLHRRSENAGPSLAGDGGVLLGARAGDWGVGLDVGGGCG